ncbi:unnamed protein product, partial [Trichobilharzia szidati]
NHVDPLVSPHCDSEVLRTNVGPSNSEENRKRRRKPKDFGADWIIPGNPRKRVKSDCIRVNDNNDLAGRLEGDEIVRPNDINEETARQLPPTDEIVGLSNSEENRKRRRKPKDFGADWIIPGNPRKRVKSDCIRVNDNNDLAGRLKGDEINRGGKSLGRTTEDLFDEVPNQDSMRLPEPLNTHRITNGLSSPTPSEGSLQSVCRQLRIATPRSSVFEGWTIILTGGGGGARSNNSSTADSVDVSVIEQLVLACGGEIAVEITPSFLDRQRQQNRHIALVSTECCRTTVYLQALATLGSIPILRTEWLLDACREDVMTSSEECRNWPLHLLLTYPGRYELPRGFISGSLEPVSWSSISVRYRSSAYATTPPPSPSLFALCEKWASREITFCLCAIVTNDVEVFGSTWLNILSIASGLVHEKAEGVSCSSPSRIPIIPVSEAGGQLSMMFPITRCNYGCQYVEKTVNFVLVDETDVTLSELAYMRTLPVVLVTSEYFIQSLIRGYLENPKSSSCFSPNAHRHEV